MRPRSPVRSKPFHPPRARRATEGGFNARLVGLSAAGVTVVALLAVVSLMVNARERLWETRGFAALTLLAIGFVAATGLYSYRAFRRHLSLVEHAQAQIRLIVDTTLDGILTTDDAGTILLANPAAARMFGTDAASLVGTPLSELVRQRASAEALSLLASGTVTADACRRDAERSIFPVEISFSEMTIDTRRRHVALIRDITERQRYECSLAEEKERLAVTLRSIGDGCVTIDNEGRILLMNPVAEKLTGWSQEDAVGRPLSEAFQLLNERTRRPCHTAMQTLIDTGSAAEIVGATVIVARDGTERVIETNAAPIRDTAERKVGGVLVFRDITERHRILEERQKAEKLESLGVAAGGIAHDFNNLLTAILGNLSLALFNPKLDEGIAERLSSAKKASLRAQELAQQLLTFAKGGAPIKQTASVAQLVRESVSFSLRGSNVRGAWQIPADLWPADIDSGQISQVMQNLAINAGQAMPAGGTLQVSCANLELRNPNQRLGLAPGRYLKIMVQDEGIGIPEENVARIFDPYFTTKPKGSGLGLATAYSIIKNHGGVIEVVSAPGAGTCFYIFLPASEHALAVVAPTADIIAIEHRPARILILDDEDAICALVACALEPHGYEVVEAYDALTAIRRYEEALRAGRRFDLVISDLTIPGGMGGQECVRRLRELDPAVRAIVSSGYATDPVMAKFRDHGFCAMIAKPYEIAALTRVVAEVLAAPAADNVIRHEFAA